MLRNSGAPLEKESKKFGTFDGVFTPCTLTILGVILFLRVGQVVGQSGLFAAMGIVLLSKLITTLTGLSLSAIATNTRVKGGGAYYLISRSLGVELGGAIGVVFYFAQAISVALYVLGFTEAFVAAFPSFDPQIVASIVTVLTFVSVYIGASWALKLQTFILVLLAISILSFAVGAIPHFTWSRLELNLYSDYTSQSGFFVMFALFFPAVTGIMAGANMSGDLANPARSIPRGTLGAVLVTGVIYLAEVVLLAGSSDREQLLGNNLIVQDLSLVPFLVTMGIFAATLSSALGSMMGAPRILQAFARDEIFSSLRFFAAGSGVQGEPRRAIVLTFIIAQLFVLLGDLDAIAPIITMFFMITYGLLNASTFYEAVTKNPSYRPRFRYSHWSLSLLGAFGCFAVMFLINPLWAAVSLVLVFALHRFISNHEIEARWGDLQSGYAFERARRSLLRLQLEAYHPKNWRPSILALSGSAATRPHLAVWGHWFTSGHGILSIAQIIIGSLSDHAERKEKYESTLRKFIKKQSLQAFPAIVVAESLTQGIESLVQCHGIGGLKPNSVLLGWPNDNSTIEPFSNNLRLLDRMGRSIICARFIEYRDATRGEITEEEQRDLAWRVLPGSIDVWWRGMDNGALMLLLAHLLHTCPEWRQSSIRVLRVVGSEDAREEVQKHISELATASRISITPHVVVADDIAQAIQSKSAEAAVVLMGFEPPQEGKEEEFFERMETIAGALPRVFFVNSAGGVELES